MKDLKIVILFALPVIAVVAGFLVINSRVEVGEPDRTEPGDTGPRDALHPDGEWPEDDVGPVAGMPRGLPQIRPDAMKDPESGEMDWELNPDRLRKLLENGENRDWVTIDQLVSQGTLEDPESLSGLLISELEENALVAGSWVAKWLPMLAARRPELRDGMVDRLLTVARSGGSPNAVKSAALVVGSVGTSRAVESLGEIARDMENPNASGAALEAIGMIGAREPELAAATLARLLEERQGRDFQSQIGKAMGLVRHPAMVDALVPLLSENSPPALRRAALLSLGSTGQAAAVPVLEKLSRTDKDPAMRMMAIKGLGRLGNREAVEQLMSRVREGGELSRTAALEIGEAKGRGVSKVILDNWERAPDQTVKQRWLHSMQQSREEAAIPGVRSVFSSGGESSQIRAEAAYTLAKLGDADSVPAIAAELDRATDLYTRKRYVEALRELVRNPRAADAMKKSVVPVLKRLTEGGVKDPASMAALRVLRMLGE